MRAQESPGRGRALAQLAARQHGVVANRQLTRLGFARGAIRWAVESGRLHRIHRGVYAVGHGVVSLHGRWMAAVLACGPGAVLSHQDAAELWDLRRVAGRHIHVTSMRSRHSQAGIRLHRIRHLHPDDWMVRDGIPVTVVARTLLDLAETLTLRELERVFEQAERLGVLDVDALERLSRRCPGRRGLKPLASMLAARYLPGLATRSPLERRFVDLCRDAGLPLPAFNAVVEGFEVDAVWPAQRVVVELDSYAFHRTREEFERDRERDAALQLAGYRVFRLTDRRARDVAGVAAMLGRALGLG